MSTAQNSQQNRQQNYSLKFEKGDLVRIVRAFSDRYELENPERSTEYKNQLAVIVEEYCGFDENDDETFTNLCEIFLQNTSEYLEWREDWLEKI
jgi:hypothetical protein